MGVAFLSPSSPSIVRGDTSTLESAEAYCTSVVGARPRDQRVPTEHSEASQREKLEGEIEESQLRVSRAWEQESEARCLEANNQAEEVGIGYKLLRQAGWKGSGGLGAQEQGIASPIAAWWQSGRQGIGLQTLERQRRASSAHEPPDLQQVTSSSTAPQKDAEANKAAGQRRKGAPKRDWESVKVEEPVDAKVKRWQQVMQAEADDHASKAIDRYMFRAFRDDGVDSNPLLRKNNLSVSNPLL